jgi:hypothetical protein
MLYMEKPLVVVRLDTSPIPPLLKDLKYIEAYGSAEKTADGISTAIGGIDVSPETNSVSL